MRKILFAATFALAPVTAFAAGPIYGPLQAQNALSELGANAAQARLNLGLGSAATHPATDFDAAGTAAGAAAAAQAASVPTTAVGSTVAPLSSGVVPTSNLPAAASGAAGIISLTTAGAQAPVQSVAGLTGAPTASTLSTALTGTAAGTLAAGNDSRITGALQSSAAGPLATQQGVNSAAAIAAGGGVIAAGGDISATVTTATGTTLARTAAARAADAINVMDFSGIDPTGTTDSEPAIQAAMTQACSFSPPKVVTFPRDGKFAFGEDATIPAGCDGLTFDGPNYSFLALASDTSSPLIMFSAGGQDNVTFRGMSASATNISSPSVVGGLFGFTAPMKNLTLNGNNVGGFHDNPFGNGIWFYEVGPTSETLTATATGGVSNSYTVAYPFVAGLHVGAYATLANDADLYVTGLSNVGAVGTITLQKVIQDTVQSGGVIHFTSGVTLTQTAPQGATTLYLDDITHIAYRWTLFDPVAGCVPKSDRITTLTSTGGTAGYVTLEAGLACPLPSGSNLAGEPGYPGLAIVNNAFANLGMGLALAGSANYTTIGDTPSGSQLTFGCVSAACATGIGLMPGNQSAATGLPAALPANDPVISRTVNPAGNSGAGTFTVTLQNAVTADVPSGTSTPWAVQGGGGNGFGMWASNGAWFANNDWNISSNTFYHTYSAPIFASEFWNLNDVSNTFTEDLVEYQSPTIAPSPCQNLSVFIGATLTNDTCSGASGTGYEIDHPLHLRFSSGSANGNGVAGISICGGDDITFNGVETLDNGQMSVRPFAQAIGNFAPYGIALQGSCSYSQPSQTTHVNVGNIVSGDDQLTPSQTWGLHRSGLSSYTGDPVAVSYGNLTAVGNITGAVDTTIGGLPLTQAGSQFGVQILLPATLIAAPTVTSGGTGYTTGQVLTLNFGWTGAVNGIVQSNPTITVTNQTGGVIQTGGVSLTTAGRGAYAPLSLVTDLSGNGASFTITNGGVGGSWTPGSSGPVMVDLCGSGGGAGGVSAVIGAAAAPGSAGNFESAIIQVVGGTAYPYKLGLTSLGGAAGANNGATPYSGTTQFATGTNYSLIAQGGSSGFGSASGAKAAAAVTQLNQVFTPPYFPSKLTQGTPINLPGIATTGAAGASSPYGTAGVAGAEANGGSAAGYCAGGGAPAATATTTALAGGNGTPGMIVLTY